MNLPITEVDRNRPSPEVLPRPHHDRLAVSDQLDSVPLLAAADDRESGRILDRGEQLIVLAEGEVFGFGTGCQRHAVEVDHDSAARARGEVAGVAGDAV